MPDLLHHIQKGALLAFLVCSMLAVGLTLTMRAIIAPLRDVGLVMRALAVNFVVAPLFAWLLTTLLLPEHGYGVGLLLLGCVAGAPFLPRLVQVAQGDQALGAALTVLLSFGTMLFLPFALPLISGLQVNPWTIARPLLLLIVLPLVVGILLKSRFAPFAARIAPILGKIGNASLWLLFVLVISLNARLLLSILGSGATLVALLYFVGLFIFGWLSGGPKPEVRGVLGLATAGRNFGAALVPAGSIGEPKITLMIITGAISCSLVTFIAARWIRRRDRTKVQ